MCKLKSWICGMGCTLALLGSLAGAADPAPTRNGSSSTANWTHAGWGGGGFYYATVFHPTRDGVIYLAGDVGGVYKSEDHGQHWSMINNGLVDYGVFSLAVDRHNPETVYAASEGGLCKSTDGGAHWQLLPQTGKKDLHITGEKNKSIRCIAVDPTDGNIVYAASPAGKVYKSNDGGKSWIVSYAKKAQQEAPDTLRVQFGKVNGAFFGGFWSPLVFPKDAKPEQCSGFGFSFKAEGAKPRDVLLTLKTSAGISYRSKNLTDMFVPGELRNVILGKEDFIVDPEYAKKNPEQAKNHPSPDWATVNRLDFVCVGSLPDEASIGRFGRFFFAFTSPDAAAKPTLATALDLAKSKSLPSYGNVRFGEGGGGSIYSVAVASKEPSLVLAATADEGLIISSDAGATWNPITQTPNRASNVAIAPSDANIIYASFFNDGVWKSQDKGKTWAKVSQGLHAKFAAKELAVSPVNPQDVYVIGADGWSGGFYFSHDGAATWQSSTQINTDLIGDPTLPQEGKVTALSIPTNIAINPLKPQELYISANWRCCFSEDGGRTWTERIKGADISCIYDIRFSGNRVYACAMDEGTLVSENNGQTWKQLWPQKWTKDYSGHNWRLAINNINGADRVIATCSPWDSNCNRIVLSSDGGKTYHIVTKGLPDFFPKANTMWGQGFARALAVDPKNPQVLYLGIDGDPSSGNNGGGIFKTEDGGNSWKQLPNQPGSRRMFFGLAVDPTDSKRLYWAACGDRGGLYRSEDGGDSWQLVFKQDQWLFNVMVTADGTVYCPGKNLFRSTDHGKTWKQLTKLPSSSRTIVAMEAHPTDPQTLWFTATTWDGSDDGAVYKTADGGATWQEITGNLPYHKPMVLRFNPATNELWAGGVGLYRLKQ